MNDRNNAGDRGTGNDSNLKKFQELLRTMFQFDCADLDFGIYRILNFKRQEVENFIANRLPEIVNQAFEEYDRAEREALDKELEQKKEQVRKGLGDQALDERGQLAWAFHDTPLGKEYLEIKEKREQYQVPEDLKTRVYNDLYEFFSRYYEEGDFISKRRYGRYPKYIIPYNGEEVVLYWANHDQYYIKTAERFNTYRFKAGNYTVSFELRNTSPEQNSNTSTKRFFVLAQENPITWNGQGKTLQIAFEYRPIQQEESNQQKTQDKLNESAANTILEGITDPHLRAILANRPTPQEPPLVLRHLNRFTRRNTTDFFIHKDLGAFLRRELDFFLKNEILPLDELIGNKHQAPNETVFRRSIQRARTIRQVAEPIIDFLAQVEDFQKKLWEKKKFVTETFYCITVGSIPEEFYPEIAQCKEQWDEWKELFHIHELPQDLLSGDLNTQEGRIEFLKAHPTLVLDTRHFSQAFTDRLLASFDDLDEMTDGLLVHSENWQALNLLLERYREQVKCIYIDPPYNSKTTKILYKNNYMHSSWICLMDNRLTLSRYLSNQDGSHVIAIDENEQEILGRLLTLRFPNHNKICVSIIHNKKGIQGDYFSYNHDFAYFLIPPSLPETHGKPIPEDEWEYANLRKWGRESERQTAKNCFYPIFVEGTNIIDFGEVCDDNFHPGQPNVPVDKDGKRIAVYPVDSSGVERKWRYSRDSVENIRHLLKVHITDTGEIQIHKARTEKPFKTVWDDSRYIAGDYGTKWLTDLGLKISENLYPKSVHTVEDSIIAVSDKDSLIFDYFAGSGTTGHAVINLNREDGGRRKFILVEMADYFDTVLLPRLKKVTFTPEWKEGKPKRTATEEEAQRSPRILKVIRLESYEDTLNNLEIRREEEGRLALKCFGDEYLLKYMLEFETQGSPSLLDLQQFKTPFEYKLKVQQGDEIVERTVDMVETFNYLLGIHVKKRRALEDKGRLYRAVLGEKDGKRFVIVWRALEGLVDDKAALKRDRTFIQETILPALLGELKPDRLFVNGVCTVQDAESIEPEFHKRMFASVGV